MNMIRVKWIVIRVLQCILCILTGKREIVMRKLT